MAVTDHLGSIAGRLGGFSEVWTYTKLLFIGLVLIFIAWFIYEQLQYKKRVYVKKLVGNTKRTRYVKAKEVKDKNNVRWWKLRGFKSKLYVPPDEVIEPDHKGRDSVTVYLTSSGDFIYQRDRFTLDNVEKMKKSIKVKMEKDEDLHEFEERTLKFLDNYDPVTTNQRASWAYQEEVNSSFDHEHFLNKHGTAIIVGMTAIMLFSVVLIFGDDVFEALSVTAEEVNAGKAIDREIVNTLQDIKQDVQRIDTTTPRNQGTPTNTTGGAS